MAAYEEETPRPRMLNLLIGVTLMTIVIALWYLLDYYYLRESTHDVTWYPPHKAACCWMVGATPTLGSIRHWGSRCRRCTTAKAC